MMGLGMLVLWCFWLNVGMYVVFVYEVEWLCCGVIEVESEGNCCIVEDLIGWFYDCFWGCGSGIVFDFVLFVLDCMFFNVCL